MTLGSLILPAILLCCQAHAQLLHPAASMPSFSVVSIRPSNPADPRPSHITTTLDAYRAERTTLRDVLSYAFGLGYDDELANAPSWVTNDHYNIEAKLDNDQISALHTLSRNDREEQVRLMMQTMLAERFHLIYHFETRRLPVYELQLAKSGLKCPPDPNAPPAIADPTRPRFRWQAAPAPPPPSPDDPPPTVQPTLHLRTTGWPFWLLVSWISHQPELNGRPVLDKTGLEGPFDCQMSWSHSGSVETGDFFVSALQNRIGLKLQPAKDPVEVLAVDSIQRPSEN
jgi:uncharacterized protein (TIGR03435 family)